MTFDELKRIIDNFEALDGNTKVVCSDIETDRLVELHLHDASVVGRCDKHKRVEDSDTGAERVLHLYISTE